MPDIMAREGIHPETPKVPFTPGWDLVGVVERLGDQVSDISPGQVVAAMPISGAYTEYLCLKKKELIPVPVGLVTKGGVIGKIVLVANESRPVQSAG